MNLSGHKRKLVLTAEILFYILVFASITCFAVLQAFGDPPDEINRFKIVSFICRHGYLPQGAEPEILIAGYGASYAFHPYLTYIIQGFLLRFLSQFTSDTYTLLLAARMVNVVFGVLMAYYVRQMSKELWDNPYLQWLFTIMVVFLPQNIFIHSYINTDSMAMLAVSMICFALLRAQRTDYEKKDCIVLSVGIILCALSYYNAYGIILAAIIIFVLNHIHDRKIEWGPMLRKGILISAIVLLGIGWWFIRCGILYHGDFLGLSAYRECVIQTATPEYNPLTCTTFQNSGRSLGDMLFGAHYVLLTFNSFIAMFGPMSISTHRLTYVLYRYFWFAVCILALFVPRRLWHPSQDSQWSYREASLPESSLKKKLPFYGAMLLFCLITVSLSIIYSYGWDFQPQGRYVLPILIPFMFVVASGVQKLCGIFERVFASKSTGSFQEKAGILLGRLFCLGVMAFVFTSFAYSLFCVLFKYYSWNTNLFALRGMPFSSLVL